MTLGNPTTHSPEDARSEANRIKGLAAAGSDPAADKKARAADERRKRGAMLKRLLDEYEAALPRRPKMRGSGLPSAGYVADEVAQVRRALNDMGAEDMPAANLSEADVRRLLGSSPNGTSSLRARFGALSRFLDWCLDAGHIKANPCVLISRIRRPKAPQARSHYLLPADLARLWEAASGLDEPVWRDLSRFLIAVPCRRGEARQLDWSHINIETAEWRQPSHMTKNRDPHRLHLHPLALSVLRARWEALAETQAKGDAEQMRRIMALGAPRAGLVFPAPISGRAVDTFSDIKRELAKSAGSTGWTWHDFRRSFASALGEAGIPEAVADAVLNHRQSATRGGVLGVYQRSSRWPEQVKAMELWGRLLTSALEAAAD